VLLGLALASANIASVLFLFAVPLVMILRAIPSEEAMLDEAFGGEYARYRSQTARLIPRVW
jgi:protein-S-isoprenylcysteine O-methyltransferase Ste14